LAPGRNFPIAKGLAFFGDVEDAGVVTRTCISGFGRRPWGPLRRASRRLGFLGFGDSVRSARIGAVLTNLPQPSPVGKKSRHVAATAASTTAMSRVNEKASIS
jgi:hypothetical protein